MRLLVRTCTFPIAALGLLGLIAALVWWVNVSPANAQVPTHLFKGKVVIDGRPAPDGTLVIALIDGNKGNKVGETRTKRGTFLLAVLQPSGQVFLRKTVNFYGETPDGKQFPFPQTARWQPGGETSIALEVAGVFRPVRKLPPPAAAFNGKVIFDGRPVEDGTQVTAYIDGVRLSGTVVTRGVFRLVVPQQSGKSFAGKAVEFRSIVLGRRISWPQTAVWKPGQISITLQAGTPVREQQPPAHIFEGKVVLDGLPVEDGTQVTAYIDGVRISGTKTRSGRFRLMVSQPSGQSFAGRTVEFRGNTVQGKRIDWPQTAIWRGVESSITLQAEFRQRPSEPRPEQPQGDRARQEEQLRLERDRLEQERRLQEERARLDQERIQEEQRRIEQEFAQREERLRREVERRNPLDQDQPPPPPEGEPSKKGPTRGFFTNSQVGQLGNINTSVDPTMLAVIGILLTLGATTMQLFRGN